MPVVFILLLMWVGSLSACAQNAAAMSIEDSRDYDRKIDINVRDQVETYVCRRVGCDIPLHVDEFKTHGAQIAALHVSFHAYF